MKRAVWERDGGQCTFVSEAGRRCAARKLLEFDHVEEVARGGRATVAGIRLRCRAHNQYGAECTFGAGFMRHKREEAVENRRREAEARAVENRRREAKTRAAQSRRREAEARVADEARRQAAARAAEEARHKAAQDRARAAAEEIITPLRLLGFRAEEARRAAALCEPISDAPLEQRVRRALSYLSPRPRTPARTPAGLGIAP